MGDARRFYFAVANEAFGVGLVEKTRDMVSNEAFRLSAGLTILFARNVDAFTVGGHQLHGGSKWAPLSAAYARRKAKKGKEQILINTGRLRQSLRVDLKEIEPGRSQFSLKSVGVPYAAYVHEGATRIFFADDGAVTASRTPARPVVFVSRDDTADVAKEVKRLGEQMLGDGEG